MGVLSSRPRTLCGLTRPRINIRTPSYISPNPSEVIPKCSIVWGVPAFSSSVESKFQNPTCLLSGSKRRAINNGHYIGSAAWQRTHSARTKSCNQCVSLCRAGPLSSVSLSHALRAEHGHWTGTLGLGTQLGLSCSY